MTSFNRQTITITNTITTLPEYGVSQVANKCDLGEVEAKLKRDPSKTRLMFQKYFSRIVIIMIIIMKIMMLLKQNYNRQEIAGKVRKTWKASHLECRWLW